MAVYEINSVQDLEDLTTKTGKFLGIPWTDNVFNLTTNLDLTGSDPAGDGLGWLPIGSWGSGTFFDGTFNGQGFVISNMTINRPTLSEAAFIGAIDPDMGVAILEKDTVLNLGLENVNVLGKTYCAGLIGYILGAGIAKGYPVINCYVTGVVTGERIAGGLVGGSNNGYFLDCYADVTVIVNSVGVLGRCEAGGFIGSDSIGTDCVNCYSKGTVVHNGTITGDTHIGGFIGEADAVYATNSFWDTETSGQATDGTNGDAVGKTTAQMKQAATFSAWDLVNDWWLTEGSTYPALRLFSSPPGGGQSELSYNRGSARGVALGINRGVF